MLERGQCRPQPFGHGGEIIVGKLLATRNAFERRLASIMPTSASREIGTIGLMTRPDSVAARLTTAASIQFVI